MALLLSSWDRYVMECVLIALDWNAKVTPEGLLAGWVCLLGLEVY
jgi:hypothetical protein